jgi:ubiquinone biosynthesis protein
MFKSIFQLFRIARKLALSGAVDTLNEIYNIPLVIKLFFELLTIGTKRKLINKSRKPGEKLCDALEGMGTTFIKLGQFLATRPDIIGETLAEDLVKLQDKLPPFELYKSKKILKKEIGDNLYQNILELSEPIAAASNLKSISIFVISLNKWTISINLSLFVLENKLSMM